MAHTRVINKDARLVAQCAAGRYLRYTCSIPVSVGQARTNNTAPNLIMADVIKNETWYKGIFVAPCAAKILAIYANGSPFVDMAKSGTTYAQFYKGVGGGADTALLSDNTNNGIAIGTATVPTQDTAIDGTLVSAAVATLTVGQHVYAKVTVSNHNVETAVAYVTLTVEWMPIDTQYASS